MYSRQIDDQVSKYYTEQKPSKTSESISVTVEHDDGDDDYVHRHGLIITKCTRLFHINFAARTVERTFRSDDRSIGTVGNGHIVFQVQGFLHLTSTENFIPTRVIIGDGMARERCVRDISVVIQRELLLTLVSSVVA